MRIGSTQIGPEGIEAVAKSTLRVCAVCHKDNATKRCSLCKCARYCSKECQAADWRKAHKGKLCSNLAKLGISEWGEESVVSEDNNNDDVVVPIEISEKEKKEEGDGCVMTMIEEDVTALAEQAFDLASGKVGYLKYDGDNDRSELPEGEKDEEKSNLLMKRAALGGHQAAQYMTAIRCLNSGNEEECLKWIRIAAHNNHAEAQLTYGSKYWYEQRNGHARDLAQAILWIRRALSHGTASFADPKGNVLSEESFTSGLRLVTTLGRKLYLSSFEGSMLVTEQGSSPGGSRASDAMKLAAYCGCVPAINVMASR